MKKRKLIIAMMLSGVLFTASAVNAQEAEETVTEETMQEAEEAVAEETVQEDEEAVTEETAAITELAAVDLSDAGAGQKLNSAYTLALYSINNEEYDKADTYLNVCMAYCDPSSNPELYADILLKKACIDVIREDYDLALVQLDAALYIQPDLADAYLVKTQIYSAQGDIDQAVAYLESYIEMTEDTALYETVASFYEATGDMGKAEEAYSKYVQGNEEEIPEAKFQTGLYRMEAGKFSEAIDAFQEYLDDDTFGAGAAYNIGVCHMNMGEYDTAVQDFTSCLEKNGEFEGLYYNRGVCSLLSGNYEDAAADFTTSMETEPYVDDARYNLAVCQMQTEAYELAIANFTELIGDGSTEEETETGQAAETLQEDTEPKEINYNVYYYRAVCRAAIGQLEEAAADYTVCIDNGYELAESYYQRAQVYAELGDAEKQAEDLEASLKYAG